MEQQHQQPQSVRVVDFDMSIANLISLFLKMAIAAIPAMMLIWFFFGLVSVALITVFGIGGAMFGSN